MSVPETRVSSTTQSNGTGGTFAMPGGRQLNISLLVMAIYLILYWSHYMTSLLYIPNMTKHFMVK